MVATQLLVVNLIAAASATSLVAREDAYFTSLLKRQEPGTPAYNCHDNCGSAITLSRGADPCTNPLFVTDYNNCLKCSGPDNYNIWRYYGGTLSSAGAKCGLDTEPLAGKQDDVPGAGSTGAVSSAAPAQTSAAAQLSTATSPAAPVSSQPAATTEATTRIPSSSSAGASSATPTPSSNATASSTASAPAEVTTNAAAGLRVNDAVGVIGAICFAALFGV